MSSPHRGEAERFGRSPNARLRSSGMIQTVGVKIGASMNRQTVSRTVSQSTSPEGARPRAATFSSTSTVSHRNLNSADLPCQARHLQDPNGNSRLEKNALVLSSKALALIQFIDERRDKSEYIPNLSIDIA